jgi:hypothetical protein
MKEIWKEVDGYENYYQISNFGRVRSLDREARTKSGSLCIRSGKILKPRLDRYGYFIIGLTDNRKQNKRLISRLVALAFIPNPENKPTVNHIDGNKLNNRVDNLEWATYGEQQKHAYSKGLMDAIGEKNNLAKLTKKQAIEIYELAWSGKYTQKEIAKMYNVSQAAINNIKNKKSWKHIHD